MQTTTTQKGRQGEKMAAAWLIQHGYTILHQQFRYERKEIDLIAQKDDCLIFVEVKLRKNNAFGYPEEAVNERKQAYIRLVAEHYLHTTDWQGNIRFDIIAITQNREETEIMHFEDAFC